MLSTSVFTLEAYLPSLDPLHILVEIRDHFDGVTAVNLTKVAVRDDVDEATKISGAFAQLLQHGNTHEMGQVLQMLSHRINKKSMQTCMTSIMFELICVTFFLFLWASNRAESIEDEQQRRRFASSREHPITFTERMPSRTLRHLRTQLSSLIHLTERPDQLTRRSVQIVLTQCLTWTEQLELLLMHLSFDDVQLIVHLFKRVLSNLSTVRSDPMAKQRQRGSARCCVCFRD